MKRNMLMAAGAGLALTLLLGPSARTQDPPSRAAGPVPTEVALTPSRADNAALATARQNPVAARLQGVLRRDPATAEVLTRAAASKTPVLVPADPALLRTARIYTGDRFYMLTVQRGEQIIEIYGATKAFRPAVQPNPPTVAAVPAARLTTARRVDPVAAALRQTPAPGIANVRTEATEYGTDVTFTRFGAAYNVSFICEGQGAAGCTPAEAVAFALSLQLVGGGV